MIIGDFETTRDINEFGAISMRVWLADFCIMETLEHITFMNIEDAVNWMITQDAAKIYFHNLKFDGGYICDYLFRAGYKWSDNPEEPSTFNFLISDMGQWFAGTIVSPDGNKIRLFDSLKKIPLPVKRIGETYKLPMCKGEIDYNAPRPIGYNPTPDEIDYVRRDTEIVARALKIHIDSGLTKMTVAADSLAGIEETIHGYYTKLGFLYFRQHPELDEFCRKAYCGGISYVNPAIREKTVGAGVVYDVNSLYPYVMKTYPYPVYHPVKIRDYSEIDSCLWIAEFDIDAEFISGCLPTLRANQSWIDGRYTGRVVLTSVDFEMLLQNYVVDYEFVRGYKWYHSDDNLFKPFVEYWGAKKEQDTGGARQLDKLMLNSGYGKFGVNPCRRKKRAALNPLENCVVYSMGEPENIAPNNVAIAAFVTAYARRELMRGVDLSTGFCYCDTDSLHLATIDGIPPEFRGVIDPKRLGAWKEESHFIRAKYLRQKTYIEEQSPGIFDVKACGMPDNVKTLVTWDNFRIGAKFPGKLVPIMRPGGPDLVEREFTIHETSFTF